MLLHISNFLGGFQQLRRCHALRIQFPLPPGIWLPTKRGGEGREGGGEGGGEHDHDLHPHS